MFSSYFFNFDKHGSKKANELVGSQVTGPVQMKSYVDLFDSAAKEVYKTKDKNKTVKIIG